MCPIVLEPSITKTGIECCSKEAVLAVADVMWHLDFAFAAHRTVQRAIRSVRHPNVLQPGNSVVEYSGAQ
jgi:hypothetical protein